MHQSEEMRRHCFDRHRPLSLLPNVAVRRCFLLLFASIVALPAARADVCSPTAFHGSYGLTLSGNTTIGGTTRQVAVVGRLFFDEYGNVTGFSSASFAGLVFGNPVTGRYEAQSDCSVTWSLRDDSGAYQHFAGKMSADGVRVSFTQTDQGGAGDGTLLRTTSGCSQSSFAGEFRVTLSGGAVDVNSGVESGGVSFSGSLLADGAGGVSRAGPDEPVAGTYDVQDDCFVKLALELPSDGGKAVMHFRAILVDNNHELLGIQSDPGRSVAIRLTAR